MSAKPKVLVLVGPTASGKSNLAVELARDLSMEIISMDSALVYRTMDIGTAKPGLALRRSVPHHLIDIRDPGEIYSAADFRHDVIDVANDIIGRGKTPLLVGGTMLYLKALKEGIAELPAADPLIRAKISAQAEQEGWASVHDTLKEIDPVAAGRINANDQQRLQRALEVYQITGMTMTELHQTEHRPCPFDLVEVAIVPPDRKQLHQRIEQRFKQMLDDGLVDEVKALHQRGDLHAGLPSIKAVGYRQVWSYLEGETNYDTMQEKAIIATRQLAKRQYTWLRGWKDLHVIDAGDLSKALKNVACSRILDSS